MQLQPDPDKRYSWPVYATLLRARVRCPVCVLVVTPDDATAAWAGGGVDLGGGNRFQPFVLGPAGVPVLTDPEAARDDPELAVLSAMAHGRDADSDTAGRIAAAAIAASIGLDAERSTLYFDLIRASLSEAARKALQAMDRASHEYQSDFARRYFAEGRASLLLRQIHKRFGPLPEAAVARLRGASDGELERLADGVLTAATLDELLA